MKKSLILLISLLSVPFSQAKTLDEIGDMTVLEFAEYLVSIPDGDANSPFKNVIDELLPPLIEEYGENKMSETTFDTLLTYRSSEVIKKCNNIDSLPRKQRDFFRKTCNMKISDKVIKPNEEIFKKVGWLR